MRFSTCDASIPSEIFPREICGTVGQTDERRLLQHLHIVSLVVDDTFVDGNINARYISLLEILEAF